MRISLVCFGFFWFIHLAGADVQAPNNCLKAAQHYALAFLFNKYPGSGGLRFTKIRAVRQIKETIRVTVLNGNINQSPLDLFVTIWRMNPDGSCILTTSNPIIQVSRNGDLPSYDPASNSNTWGYPQTPSYPNGPIPTNIGE